MTGKYGAKFFQKVRPLVVVREQRGYCLCLPLTTHGGQGTLKHGVNPEDYAVVHEKGKKPYLKKSEHMSKSAFPIIIEDPQERIDRMTRINFGRVCTVEHRARVLKIGRIDDGYLPLLRQYFLRSMAGPGFSPEETGSDEHVSFTGNATPVIASAGPSQYGYQAFLSPAQEFPRPVGGSYPIGVSPTPFFPIGPSPIYSGGSFPTNPAKPSSGYPQDYSAPQAQYSAAPGSSSAYPSLASYTSPAQPQYSGSQYANVVGSASGPSYSSPIHPTYAGSQYGPSTVSGPGNESSSQRQQQYPIPQNSYGPAASYPGEASPITGYPEDSVEIPEYAPPPSRTGHRTTSSSKGGNRHKSRR